MRRGYLGLASLSYPIRFRNLQIRELPRQGKLASSVRRAADLGKWFVSEASRIRGARPGALGRRRRASATKEKFRDFELRHVCTRRERTQ